MASGDKKKRRRRSSAVVILNGLLTILVLAILAVGRDHAIDARLLRQGAHEVGDDSHAVRERSFARKRVLARFRFQVDFVVHDEDVGKSVKKPKVRRPLHRRHHIDSM